MTLDQVREAAAALGDEELRQLELWIRRQLDPHPADLRPADRPDAEQTSYRLKYFKCGTQGCRCHRGFLHGPYLFSVRRNADGGTRQHYIGRVAVERQDEPRQLELEFRGS